MKTDNNIGLLKKTEMEDAGHEKFDKTNTSVEWGRAENRTRDGLGSLSKDE